MHPPIAICPSVRPFDRPSIDALHTNGRSCNDETRCTSQIGSANTTPARVAVEDAIYDVSNFIDSLNSTALAVTLLDVYTNRVEVNSSQLLDPHCPYNVTFDGEAMEYLGRPWLALPTVEAATAAVVGAVGTADGEDNNGNLEASTFSSGSSSLTNETTLTAITYAKTSWEAGGAHQSFGRHEGSRI